MPGLGGFARATPLTGLLADLSWRNSKVFFSFMKHVYQSLAWDMILSSSRRGTFQMIEGNVCATNNAYLWL